MSEENSGKDMGRRDMFLRTTALAAAAGLAATGPIRLAQAQATASAGRGRGSAPTSSC